jgi:deoxyribodipyrimidine photo-lyase
MITASFLCKDLHIDWRWGERHFMENLIDGDFCSNNGGWQWAASTGTDAAPYFRIFNPTTQGQRFDAKGEFIQRYVPELRHLSGKALHQPPESDIYPAPIVEHKEVRQITLALFKNVRD